MSYFFYAHETKSSKNTAQDRVIRHDTYIWNIPFFYLRQSEKKPEVIFSGIRRKSDTTACYSAFFSFFAAFRSDNAAETHSDHQQLQFH
ncbi:MAG: hypothetical protein V8T87_14430 [Victivallales bacterium]